MPTFGKRSEEILSTLHPNLITVLRTAIQIKDFTIVEGFRDKAAQDAAFTRGASKIKWPNGKHNTSPSMAVDIRPWDFVKNEPVPWDKTEEYILLAGIIIACAYLLDIPIRWGHDWNRNALMLDEVGKLVDMPHFELV